MKALFISLVTAAVFADSVADLQMLSRAHYAGSGERKIGNYLAKRMQEEFERIKSKYSKPKQETDNRKLPIIVKTDPYIMSQTGTFSQGNQHGGGGAGNSGPNSNNRYNSENPGALDDIYNSLDMGEETGNLAKDSGLGSSGVNNLDKGGKGTIGSVGVGQLENGIGGRGNDMNQGGIGLNGAGNGNEAKTAQMSKFGDFDGDKSGVSGGSAKLNGAGSQGTIANLRTEGGHGGNTQVLGSENDGILTSNAGGARLRGSDDEGTISNLHDEGNLSDKSKNLDKQNTGLGEGNLLGENSQINQNQKQVEDQGQKLQDPTGNVQNLQQTTDLDNKDTNLQTLAQVSQIDPISEIQTSTQQSTGGDLSSKVQPTENDPKFTSINLESKISINVDENEQKLSQTQENTITEAKLEIEGGDNKLNNLAPTLNSEILESNTIEQMSKEGSIFTKESENLDKVENLQKANEANQESNILSVQKQPEDELVAKREEQERKLSGTLVDLSKVGYFWNMASGSDQPRASFLSPRYLLDRSAISVNKLSFNKIQQRSLRAKPSLSVNLDRRHPQLAEIKRNKIRIDDMPLSASAIQTITGSGTDDDRMRQEFETVTSMTKNELMLRQLLRN